MARDIAHDLAMPIAELLATAWRGVSDHVLFDMPLEGVKPGAEASSTALYALVLDYAAVQLRSYPAALDAARAHLAQEARLMALRPGVIAAAAAALALATGCGLGIAGPFSSAAPTPAVPKPRRRGKGSNHAKRVTRLGGNHAR